jgi:hypothetical protein
MLERMTLSAPEWLGIVGIVMGLTGIVLALRERRKR